MHRHHLGVLALDLGARGRLRAAEAGAPPAMGDLYDWVLTVRGDHESAGHSGDGAAGDLLRPHERTFLELVADTPGGLLSSVRARRELHDVFVAMRDDVVARGWLHHAPGLTTRTPAGRQVHEALKELRRHFQAGAPSTGRLVRWLPLACAVGLGDLWEARLGQRRPPAPDWLVPGKDLPARGWLGVFAVAGGLSAPPGRKGSVVPGDPSSFSWPPP